MKSFERRTAVILGILLYFAVGVFFGTYEYYAVACTPRSEYGAFATFILGPPSLRNAHPPYTLLTYQITESLLWAHHLIWETMAWSWHGIGVGIGHLFSS